MRERLAAKFDSAWNTLDIGDGWLPIVDRLDRAITEIAPDYRITQVKEKFGGLRYYIGAVPTEVSDEVHRLISEAEDEADRTCERCGTQEGVTSEGRWIKTLCPACRERREQERTAMWADQS